MAGRADPPAVPVRVTPGRWATKRDLRMAERIARDPHLRSDLSRAILYHAGVHGGIIYDVRTSVREHLPSATDAEILAAADDLEERGYIVYWPRSATPERRWRINGVMYLLGPRGEAAYPWIEVPDYVDARLRPPPDVEPGMRHWRRDRELELQARALAAGVPAAPPAQTAL